MIYLKIPQELGVLRDFTITGDLHNPEGIHEKKLGIFQFFGFNNQNQRIQAWNRGAEKLYRFTEYQLQNVGFNQKRKVNHTCRIEAATNCSFTNRNGYITCKMLSNMK